MNRITRLLAIAGMGVGATIALAGPAQAATSTASHATSASAKANWGDDDRIVGYFNSPFACDRAGRFGEDRGRWDDYDCFRVGFDFRGGSYALSVSENDWNDWDSSWDGPFDGGHFIGPWDRFGGGWRGGHHGGGPIVIINNHRGHGGFGGHGGHHGHGHH